MCSLTVGVTRGPCQWPGVTVFDVNKCLTETMCAEWNGMQIKKHYRSQPLNINAYVTTNCTSTKIAHHTWQVINGHSPLKKSLSMRYAKKWWFNG